MKYTTSIVTTPGVGRVKGLGDVVEKVARAVGADKLAAMYERLTGKECGCQSRKKRLNELLPFKRS